MPVVRRSQIKSRSERRLATPDYVLSVLTATMMVVGFIVISSASVVMSKTVAEKANHYLINQMISGGIGLFALYVGYKINYNLWKKFAPLLLGTAIIALIAVFIPGLGFHHGGANRWIVIGPINFQPAEFTKLALIMYLATFFENKGKEVKTFLNGAVPFAAIIGLIIVLVMLQPDMGTTTVLASIAGAMFFIAGASYIHIAEMFVAAVAAVAFLIKTAPYRMARFTIFLNPEQDSKGIGYHINQALLAVGSGGLLGYGFGRSRQKFNYLPEAATDSVFAVVAEELGFIRSVFIIILFLLFAFRGYKIAKNAPDTFTRLVAVGITTWITAQAFINMLAILSMMPLTGVPLPFLSYGGTSLISIMFACGILLNISKYTKEGEGSNARTRIGRGNWWTHFTGISRRIRTR